MLIASAPVAAQDPAAQRALFQLKLAQAVDDRCRMMPAEVRRDFDARIAKLAAGSAEAASREAARRVEGNPPKCDEATEGFLRQSVATAQRLIQ